MLLVVVLRFWTLNMRDGIIEDSMRTNSDATTLIITRCTVLPDAWLVLISSPPLDALVCAYMLLPSRIAFNIHGIDCIMLVEAIGHSYSALISMREDVVKFY